MSSALNRQRIAYLCLCHMDPCFIKRLSQRLSYGDDCLFIHVDAKVDITPFLSACYGLSNVYFVDNENRVKVYWGGYNSIVATMNTVKLAKRTGVFSRFVLLQGQDYPMYSNEFIHSFFEDNSEVEFCHASDVTVSKEKGRYMKAFGYWWEDQKLWSNFLFRCLRGGFSRANSFGIKYRKGNYNNMNVFWGRANWAITGECMDYIMDIYETDKGFNRFFKHRFPPDELYFHTIIHNSRFKQNVSRFIVISRDGYQTALNLVYSEYPGSATVFKNADDLDALRKTGCLFVRKVNSSSLDLLDEIDRRASLNI